MEFVSGQRVRITGKQVAGTVFDPKTQITTQVDTFVYVLAEAGRGWEKNLAYMAETPLLEGTIVAANATHIQVQLDETFGDIKQEAWAMKPYKRKDGTTAPNASLYLPSTIRENHVYGLTLRYPIVMSLKRNTVTAI